MTVAEMKTRVMTQSGEDMEDLPEFSERILSYLNDGYMQLLGKYLAGRYDAAAAAMEIETATPLSLDTDEPLLPERFHSAVADFATYLMYRNGNAPRQARGQMYLAAFNEAFLRLKSKNDEEALASSGGRYRLKNLYS